MATFSWPKEHATSLRYLGLGGWLSETTPLKSWLLNLDSSAAERIVALLIDKVPFYSGPKKGVSKKNDTGTGDHSLLSYYHHLLDKSLKASSLTHTASCCGT